MHSLVTIPITGRFIFKVFAIGPFLLSSINSFFFNEPVCLFTYNNDKLARKNFCRGKTIIILHVLSVYL
jgi:hypothetical protein